MLIIRTDSIRSKLPLELLHSIVDNTTSVPGGSVSVVLRLRHQPRPRKATGSGQAPLGLSK